MFQQSLDIYREINDRGGLATSLNGLGDTTRAVGDLQAARQCFHLALQIATDIQFTSFTLVVLSGIGELLLDAGQPEQAAQLLSFVLHHPASDQETQDQAQPVFSTVDLWQIGGAVSPKESAFNGRQAAFLLNPEANWEDPADDEVNITWVREFINDMREFSDGSRYLNFPGFQEEGDEMMRKAFGPQYVRLTALKKKYDPTNLFSLNQNITPNS